MNSVVTLEDATLLLVEIEASFDNFYSDSIGNIEILWLAVVENIDNDALTKLFVCQEIPLLSKVRCFGVQYDYCSMFGLFCQGT